MHVPPPSDADAGAADAAAAAGKGGKGAPAKGAPPPGLSPQATLAQAVGALVASHCEPIEAAAALLELVTALRGPAVVFGSESDRQRLNAELTDYLTIWANEALDCIADGEAPDVDRALRLVGIAARYLTSIEALEAARTVRRRAATAETARATAGAASRAL